VFFCVFLKKIINLKKSKVMFGLDLGKMLSGDGGGMGGNMITNMLMKQLAAPGTQKMITEKIDEMLSVLAQRVNCKEEELSLLFKMEKISVKNENGELLLEENNEGVSVQKMEKAPIIYVMVGNAAKEKIFLKDFLAMMKPE
jgi:hypothetical protein